MYQRGRARQFATAAEAKRTVPAPTAVYATDGGSCRYLRLYWMCARTCLIREMTFRGNFLIRCGTHIVWIVLQVAFFRVIFLHTERIGDWDRHRYLFFLGTFLTLNATVNCLFIGNCAHFSELIRTGSLDFLLLKPIDEQFLISCQRIDWAMIPEALFGCGLSIYASLETGASLSAARIAIYLVVLVAGLALLYSFLLALAASSVWAVRHSELYELWFYVIQFTSYPPDIYGKSSAGTCVAWLLTYVVPILLAVNVPARYAAMALESWKPAAHLALVACVAFAASRWFLGFALNSYRSASS